jgi:hypothetical protein
MDQDGWLKPLLTDAAALKREATKRRKPFKETSVAKSDAAELIEQGWEVAQELKRTIRLRREWPHEERPENRAWLLFHLLGYTDISSGRNFKVKIERKGAEPLWKQIDVLAKDDETVVVTECKSCAQVTRRSLQKDIEEFSNLKGPIAAAVKKHYGTEPKLKIIWPFVTNNVIWS